MGEETTESGKCQEIRGSDGRFLPGVSGNPAGMPKGIVSLKTIIKRQLAEIDPKTRKTKAEELIQAAIKHAIDGNSPYLKIVMDANDGAVPEKIEITFPDGSKKAPEDMGDDELDAIIARNSEP